MKCAEKPLSFLDSVDQTEALQDSFGVILGGRDERELCGGGLQQLLLLFSSPALDTRLTARPRSQTFAIKTEILLSPT